MSDPTVSELFAEDGPLARALPGYRVRTQQAEMAQAVAETIAERGTLVAEAGTGTGKTYAYLGPALLAGGKVLVSTGTRTLQDQLFQRDLPQIARALTVPVVAAMLKGRGNYVCHLHLERTNDDERALKSRAEISQLRAITLFAQRTRTGDRAELPEVPDNADIWQRVTSTRDNCLGGDCPHLRECFVVKARKAAQEADVVVVNHALFMADLVLKDEGISELLPAADVVIFDEAHQLPGVATRFLGEVVSTHQVAEFARDVMAMGHTHARENADWVTLVQPVEQAARDLRLACSRIDRMPGQRSAFHALPEPHAFDEAVRATRLAVAHLSRIVAAVRERHPDLELLARRGLELLTRLQRWGGDMPGAAIVPPLVPADSPTPPLAGEGAVADEAPAEVQAAPAHTPDVPDASASAPESAWEERPATPQADDDGWVRWVETTQSHVRLHSAPLSVARIFSRYRPAGQAWIMASATLSVRGDFTHFTRQLGLFDARTGSWESPFDYAANGLLFVPQGLPAPNEADFTPRFVEALLPALEASQGSALILCTTLRAVDRVASLLAEAFAERGWDWPLLRQGERGRGELLESLRTRAHAVLVGSASFWEGIDVPGNALTLVAIDKLPFAPPDDPVIEARIRACKQEGGNPFFQYQLPDAAIALKQGAGRLIRTEDDWGVLMVGDRRLVEKPYGKLLWRGLPPFTRTRNTEDVQAFFAERKTGEGKTAASSAVADGDAARALITS